MTERDYGLEAQEAAEAHLGACWDWFYQEEEWGSDEPPGPLTDPTSAPFDGCPTCEVREVLYVAWPIIAEGIMNGDLTREDLVKAGAHEQQ